MLTAWLRIGPDDSVTMMIPSAEMGQGITTSLPMLIAEELEIDWPKVQFEFAPANPAYANPIFHMQATGGSTSQHSGLLQPAASGRRCRPRHGVPGGGGKMGCAGFRMHCRQRPHHPFQRPERELWRADRCRRQTAVTGQRRAQGAQQLAHPQAIDGTARHAREGQWQRSVRH